MVQEILQVQRRSTLQGDSACGTGGHAVRALTSSGSLALGWHVHDGPSGCVATHEVKLRPCTSSVLDLRMCSSPSRVRVEEPFEIEVEVANRGGRILEPSVVLDLRLMGAVKVHGATCRPVGKFEPNVLTTTKIMLRRGACFAIVFVQHLSGGST